MMSHLCEKWPWLNVWDQGRAGQACLMSRSHCLGHSCIQRADGFWLIHIERTQNPQRWVSSSVTLRIFFSSHLHHSSLLSLVDLTSEFHFALLLWIDFPSQGPLCRLKLSKTCHGHHVRQSADQTHDPPLDSQSLLDLTVLPTRRRSNILLCDALLETQRIKYTI